MMPTKYICQLIEVKCVKIKSFIFIGLKMQRTLVFLVLLQEVENTFKNWCALTASNLKAQNNSFWDQTIVYYLVLFIAALNYSNKRNNENNDVSRLSLHPIFILINTILLLKIRHPNTRYGYILNNCRKLCHL